MLLEETSCGIIEQTERRSKNRRENLCGVDEKQSEVKCGEIW